jgi:hypothetical protein
MPPTWGQVRQFCLRQGYRETRTDHFHYLKVLPDRSTSGTMVSMGVDGEEVPSQLWRQVWSRQLRLASEGEFWNGLRGGPIAYAIPPNLEPAVPLPDYLERFLRDTLHLPESEIAAITRAQAQELLNQYHSRELHDP